MPTLRELCPALAPAYLERSPHLPAAPRTGISAIPPCRSGPDGHSRSQCPSGGGHHHLEQARPGPPGLRPGTVPETRRPGLRAHQRPAAQALCHASATAHNRLAPAPRFLGTALPGFPGGLPTWGRPLQAPPHLHDRRPGGGLAKDRTTWRPSRAPCCVPVNALSPISRARFKAAMRHGGWLAHLAPQVWPIPGNVHRQAHHHGHAAFRALAPSVFQVASANKRLVSLPDRTVTFSSRTGGRARLRTAHLDALEGLRRVRQHVGPEGCRQVRHGGLRHARCAIAPATIRLTMEHGHPSEGQPTQRQPPPPLAARGPPCGAPRHVVRRVWTAPRAWGETGCAV
jgi:hypothetical protein